MCQLHTGLLTFLTAKDRLVCANYPLDWQLVVYNWKGVASEIIRNSGSASEKHIPVALQVDGNCQKLRKENLTYFLQVSLSSKEQILYTLTSAERWNILVS